MTIDKEELEDIAAFRKSCPNYDCGSCYDGGPDKDESCPCDDSCVCITRFRLIFDEGLIMQNYKELLHRDLR